MDNLSSILTYIPLTTQIYCLYSTSLTFSIDVNFQTYPNLVWCIFLHALYSCVFLDHIHIVDSIPHIRSFFHFSFSIKAYGTVKCFVFLSFLLALANFGLVTPIPVGIRVLGVETPLRN